MRKPLIALALPLALTAARAAAQYDPLATARAAVKACVEDVREQAKRPKNFQSGHPPMWSDFDAYLAPDGRIVNNADQVGDMEGLFRLKKCLAERGVRLQ